MINNANTYSRYLPEIYRGIVEDNADPQSIGRCKIRVPAIHGKPDDLEVLVQALPWAIPVAPYSINQSRGCVNVPDVGDIVWVMFECGDKTRPVYLGGYYAVSDLDGQPKDTSKVTIYTEAGNEISYDRESGTYNISVSPSSSITIEGEKITIASTEVLLNGPTNVNGDLTVYGNIHTGDVYLGDIIGTEWVPGGVDRYAVDGLTEEEMQALIDEIAGDPGAFLTNVEQVKALMAAQGVTYNQSGYVTLMIGGEPHQVRTDCSGLVGAMATQYLMNNGKSYEAARALIPQTSAGWMAADYVPGFQKVAVTEGMTIPSGSVVVRSGHVEVYGYKDSNGKDHVYSGGSTKSLNASGMTYAGGGGYSYAFVPTYVPQEEH